MKKNLSKLFVLFTSVFVYLCVPIIAIPTPKPEIVVNSIVFKLLNAQTFKERKKIRDLITGNLEDAYYQAFQEFDKKKGLIKNEAGKDLKCIIDAVDSYRNRFASQSVYIHFTFDDMYKEYLGKKKTITIESFPGDRDINGKPAVLNKSNKEGITVGNAFKPENFMIKFTTAYKCCNFEAFLRYILDENYTMFYNKKLISKYLSKKMDILKKPKNAKYEWKKNGVVQSSLRNMIFHEFLHRALMYAGGDIQSRVGDEATIEDFVSKIFKREDNFKWPYMLGYSYGEWGKLTSQVPTKLAFPYYDDNISRRFNPPIIHDDEKIRYKDKSVCDDARCEKLIKYIIPVRDCCSGAKSASIKSASGCEPCEPEPPGNKDREPSKGHEADNADDYYGFADSAATGYDLAPEAIIFTGGSWRDAVP